MYVYANHLKNDSSLVIQRPGEVALMRGPKPSITDRSEYEFFSGLDGAGNPQWTSNLQSRRHVFLNPEGVGWNTSVSYNPGIERYLLITEHNESGTGNIGIFDAPEPWGPWTTVLYRRSFGGSFIEGTTFFWNFSNKWLRNDGRRFVLIFYRFRGKRLLEYSKRKFYALKRIDIAIDKILMNREKIMDTKEGQEKDTGLSAEQELLQSLWEDHVRFEFATHNTEDTLDTMVEDAYVNHMPVLTGGVGKDALREFYSRRFIPQMPPDTVMTPISRTIGNNQLVDEMVFKFTHTIMMDWMLPGVPPTGKRVEVPLVAIVQFREGKLAHEHIYWDQASVLVQLGLLDASALPVAGVETARKALDPGLPSNVLIERADRKG